MNISFGNLTTSTGSVENPFRYTGREFDSETGLSYYRARYYDPQVGHFLSEDPVRFNGGTNFFAYVSNRPTALTDPFGLAPTSWHRRKTDELARKIFGPKCEDKAKAVAQANAAVDENPSLWEWTKFLVGQGEGWRWGGPHFPVGEYPDVLADNAILTCDLNALGRSLHSIQDQSTHWNSPWSPLVHWQTLVVMDYAGVITGSGAALDKTESKLRRFKEKCLKCCE